MKGADPRINQNILFFIIKTYGCCFFSILHFCLVHNEGRGSCAGPNRKGGKKMRCKLTPSYSILLLLFLLFFFLFYKLFVASFHSLVSNQLRHLFANLEHLLLKKRKGSKREKKYLKRRNKRKTNSLMVKRKTEG